jgi:hypothetical protein
MYCLDAKACPPESNRGWRIMQIVFGLITISILTFSVIFLKIFDSPRYLFSKKRYLEAGKVLRQLSMMNKNSGCDAISKFDVFANSQEQLNDSKLKKEEKGSPLIQIFSGNLRMTTIMIICIFNFLSLGNYSFFMFVPTFLKMSSGRTLSYTETYTNFTIFSLCQIPGYLF